MSKLTPREPGAMFWAGRDDLKTICEMGVRCGQMGIPGDYAMDAAAAGEWKTAIAARGFTVVTLFAAYEGERYSDIPTVEATVGFIPAATREARILRTLELSDFAAKLGVGSIACHIGFVPEETSDPDYTAVREAVRRVCGHAARHGQTFALETGQEPAPALLQFIEDVDRENLGINFDPANMILYGTGEPVEALWVVRERVLSVHLKDGIWPPKDKPEALGTEVSLGQGDVGIGRFVEALREIGFTGPLNVEREAEDQSARLRDMAAGIELLRSLK